MTKRASICVVLLCIMLAQSAWADFAAGKRAYDKGDYATALKEWKPLADQGLADAQFNLGEMYHRGEGVAQNYAEAVRWYREAAEQGHAIARAALGYMYYRGKGVPQDYVQSYMRFDLAASSATGDDQKKRAYVRDAVAEKMTAEQIAVNDYVEQFNNQRDRYARMIFAVHSPSGELRAPGDLPVQLWTCDRVAEFVVHVGLGEWVESRLA